MSAVPETVTDSDETEFVRVCRVDELPAVGVAAAEVNGTVMAIVHTQDGAIHAVDDTCSHANVSLSEGELDGCTLECWLHGSRFDVRTGAPSGPPATIPINVYPVKVEDDEVFVGTTPVNTP
ncbi:non-heme iron oxygenase ferredoxin subunit [Nostocoides sp. HKS02]|uniref:non-heme iron oxygenase ferredoxin subunit n=1 Tax=Nostocoides sp. HKS02 TaxID=1813880 RepID=UPI0012B46B76|nr:non-heme iron oxygenase ferredoxin subunit [Tetrasphaera sp. HKS02]QGN57200.1 Rieske 2Fe-2S domain-containing protein [Tetrasphaera sp. HKS02]